MTNLPTHRRFLQLKKRQKKNTETQKRTTSLLAHQCLVDFFLHLYKMTTSRKAYCFFFFPHLYKMMTSRKAYCFFFSSLAEDDNELGSQLIIILDCFLFSCRRQQWTSWLVVVFNIFFLVVENDYEPNFDLNFEQSTCKAKAEWKEGFQ
jgi:hypothetical protein